MTTPSLVPSSSTGALTVVGGIGAAKDSYFNGVRVGRGGGSIDTNVAIGSSALFNNVSGSMNTAVGYGALTANSMGFHNTAIGTQALHGNISGYSNVAIGEQAGWNTVDPLDFSDELRYANNSIYIGAGSKGYSNEDQNSIVIGAGAVGEGANTTVIGTSATTKTHLYGTVEASAFTVNNVPVMTNKFGQGASLTSGGLLAIGSNSSAAQSGSIAIGQYAAALGTSSIALGTYSNATSASYESIALTGGVVSKGYSLAAGYGDASGEISMAFGVGLASGNASIALGGYDWLFGTMGNLSSGENSTTVGGIGNQASGFASFASGYLTKAVSANSTSLGSLNKGLGTSTTGWVETDPVLEVGNGYSIRNGYEPAASNRSNAITTLKNGQTTLTNKAWKANSTAPLADPTPTTDSGGEALVVEGHARLMGKVIIDQPQGDISMGIYQ